MITIDDQTIAPGLLLETFCRERAEVGALASFSGLARAESGAAQTLELRAYPGFTDAGRGDCADPATTGPNP